MISAFQSCHVKGNRTMSNTFKTETNVEKYLREERNRPNLTMFCGCWGSSR